MSIITNVLGPAAYELIRHQLGLIISTELLNQSAIGYEDVLGANVYGERFVPFSESELPAVNISLLRIPVEGHTFEQAEGLCTFCIDCYTKGVSTPDHDGDSFAQQEMHKLVGVVLNILNHSRYVRLGFVPPFIQRRTVTELKFAEPEKDDSFSVARGRITLEVSAVELAGTSLPVAIAYWQTQIKLSATEKGYFYFGGPGTGVVVEPVLTISSALNPIPEVLPVTSFEIIRDRVATIIADELENQAVISYEDVLLARVYGERMFKMNISETPAVNVSIARVPMNGQTFEQIEGVTHYYIDCFVTAKSELDVDGDAQAQIEMQKLVASIFYILHHSKYVRLGFAPPFIQWRRIVDVKFADPMRKDSFSVAKGRITLQVSAPEFSGVVVPSPLNEFQTTVKLYETDKGYLYFGTQPEPPGDGIFDDTFDPTFP